MTNFLLKIGNALSLQATQVLRMRMTTLALRAETAFPPQNRLTDGSFGSIIARLLSAVGR